MMDMILGKSLSNRTLVWKNADNPHAVITGQSGTGKSHLIKKLLPQAIQQGAVCLVFDYSGDFRDYSPPDNLAFLRMDVLSSAFTVNPLIGTAKAEARTQQLLSLLHSVFRLGPRATTTLGKITPSYLASVETPSLEGLLDSITSIEDAGKGLTAVLEPLELLESLLHSGSQSISLDLSVPKLIVLDLTSVFDPDMLRIMVEIILRSIWNQQTSIQETSGIPLVLVLDECQNLSWRPNGMAVRILHEGRKFDIAGWFSTQWLDNGNKEATAALGQAALQAYFRPDNQHIDNFAKKLSKTGEADFRQYQQLVRSLRKGQFLWQRSDGRAVIINVEK